MLKNLLEKLKKVLNKPITLNETNNQKRVAALLSLVALLSVFPSVKKSNDNSNIIDDITLEELNDDVSIDEVNEEELNDVSTNEIEEDELNTNESSALIEASKAIKQFNRLAPMPKIEIDFTNPTDPIEEDTLNTEPTEAMEETAPTEVIEEPTPTEATISVEEPIENPNLEIPNIPIPDTGDYLSLVEKEIVVRYKFELADDTRWKKVVCTLMGEEGTKYNHMYEAVSCLLNRYDCYEKGRKYNNVYDLLITSGEFTAYGGKNYQEYYVLSMEKLKTYPSYEAIIDCLFSETPNHNFLQFRDGGRSGQGVKLSEGGDRFFCPVSEGDYKPMEERRYYQKVVEVLSNENHELYDLFLRISEEDMPSIKYYNDQKKLEEKEIPEESDPIVTVEETTPMVEEETNDLETESTDTEIIDTISETTKEDAEILDEVNETDPTAEVIETQPIESNNLELEKAYRRILVRR